MSIIIHFNPSPYIPSAAVVPSTSPCLSKSARKLEMLPGIEHSDGPVMTDDESSMVDIATSNTLYTHVVKEVKTNVNHSLGSCFGLPYQDHNYGAPPPPTPPSCSPCASPAHANGIPDEDTNLSVVSTSTTNEEAQGGSSVTRCICGFEHDDEYMICCDRCLVWQHVDCMGLDRNNIPETYLCERCEPRKVDRHKAKVLQTRKKVAMTDSSESDEESSNKNSERRPKTRSKRRKKEDDKNDEKGDCSTVRRSKNIAKHSKERIDMKRSKLKRSKNKDSTSTAEEDLHELCDIYEYSENNFEFALYNQYTPEVQHIARQLNAQGYEKKILEQLETRECKVAVKDSTIKLLCMCDLPRDQPIIEVRGKFLLTSQFWELHPVFRKRIYPYVLFYMLNQEEICVDASLYGNNARFVRKSCKPNADLRHMIYNGNLHLYLISTKVIFKEDEVTIPFDFNDKESLKDCECACQTDDCLLKSSKKNGSIEICQEKKRKGRRSISLASADEDSSQSLGSVTTSKLKTSSPVKNITVHQVLASLPSHTNSEHLDTKGPSDHETEEQVNERKKKMTREERKIDAIMRAFDQMEKAKRRRQQALERQKTLQPKSEEGTKKSEPGPSVPREEENVTVAAVPFESHHTEDKVISTPKPKKGKRRRGSGTPSRRRTRSGCSDILQDLDDTTSMKSVEITSSPVCSLDNNNHVSGETSTVPPATLNNVSSASPVPSMAPVLLKTKRALLHEWLQVKSESTAVSTPVTSPLSIHTEVKWNVSESTSTCYVRCTKDGPHSGGISAAHLRRSSSSGHIRTIQTNSASGPASAKKRWLRQAMHDCNTCDAQLSLESCSMEALPSPSVDNGCLSPTCHTDLSSPGGVPDDHITPLKKRRLMRESVESVASPLSPSVTNCIESTSATVSNSLSSEVSVESGMDASDQPLLCDVNSLTDSPEKESVSKINGNTFDTANTPRQIASADEMEISDGEQPCSSFSNAYNSFSEKLDSNELTCNIPGSSMQKHCDYELKIKDDIKTKTVQETDCSELSPIICIKTLSQTPDLAPETYVESKRHLLKVLSDKTVSDNKKSANTIDSSEGASVDTKSENISAQNLLSRTHTTDNQVLSSVNISNFVTSRVSESLNQVAVSPCEPVLTSPKVSDHLQPPKNETDHASKQDMKLCEEQNSVPAVNFEHSVSPGNRNSVVSDCLSIANNISYQTTCGNVSSSVSDCVDIPVVIQASNHNSDNIEKAKETGESDLQPVVASSETPEPARSSATQKRKVSLSEYRLRMRESINRVKGLETTKKCTSASKICATAIPEKLPEQVTLAPLPLFDTSVTPGSPAHCSSKSVKKKNEMVKSAEEETKNECLEYRGNLTERLKREFGFDDDVEGSTMASLGQTKPVNNAKTSSNQIIPSVPVCAQPPPPPPPPPPRPPRPNQTLLGGPVVASSPQFGFHVAPPYPQPPYIINQVPGAQYVPAQPALAVSALPSVHPAGVQCTVRPSLLPSAHSFASSVPSTVLRPPTQHEYASLNAQNYAALVHQPPPPPPQKAFPHVYQPGLYK